MTFLAVDHVYEANFGSFVFHLRFTSEKEADKTTVVPVEDFEQGIVSTTITLLDSTFLNLRGTVKEVR